MVRPCDPSRALAKRFMARNPNGLPPTYIQAGIYTEVAFYLKAIQAAGTDNADKVVAQMRTMKINDFMTKNGWLVKITAGITPIAKCSPIRTLAVSSQGT